MRRDIPVAACLAVLAAFHAAPALAQEDGILLSDTGPFRLRAGLELGLLVTAQDNAFWKLNETFAPGQPFDASPAWAEGYAKPYLSFDADLGGTRVLYGKLSAIASYTAGTDVFDASSSGRVAIEDAYVGLRTGGEGALGFDLSIGAQRYELGTGMLISDGGADGFERGALIFGPRLAWENTAIARARFGSTRLEVFYLDANETESGDTGTRLAGAAVMHEVAAGRSFGAAAGRVLESEAPWIQAAPGGVGAPTFLPGGRDGLEFVTAWGTWALNERFTISADAAFQRNDDPDMQAWGGRLGVAYARPDLRFSPVFGYSVQTFSGDDPDTARLERFDPLFYDGSPAGWGSGANASLVFLNSNVTSHQVYASLTVSPRDFLTLRYFHVRANELNSPLQFGQTTRIDTGGSNAVVTGVTDAHLSDDLYVEYTRILSPTTFLTAGASVSYPGAGTRDQRGGRTDVWVGAFANIVWRF